MSQSGQNRLDLWERARLSRLFGQMTKWSCLLKLEYKVSKTSENVDWESRQTKYSDILNLLVAHFPSPFCI